MARNRYHLVPAPSGWALKKEGAKKAVLNSDNKAELLEKAIGVAKNQKAELTIHRKDGVIQDSDSYGNDPRSVKDTKY